jgi:hypothetical protein
MRDYVYIYSESINSITASGIEFSDLVEAFKLKNLLLLKHKFSEIISCSKSNFDTCEIEEIKHYSVKEIYNFGDFSFIDLPELHYTHYLEDQEIAEILYFGHMSKPMKNVSIKNLKNSFMVYIHDNGYFLRIFYQDSINPLLSFIKLKMKVEFDNNLVKSKYLLIKKNKIEVFDYDIGLENAISLGRKK